MAVVLRLIRQSRINHFKGTLLACYNRLKKPFSYAIIRLLNNCLYADFAYYVSGRHCNVIRYKIVGRPFIDLYRKKKVQDAFIKYALKHVKI